MQTGNDVKEARVPKDWSQRELARRADFDRNAVSHWEARPVLDPKGYATGKMTVSSPI
ncbi:helix-turn-helix transcriptional regulator [Lutimaribacter saemankumensis]